MIEHGHIDINISKEDLDSLDFKDEVICYKQLAKIDMQNCLTALF